jgi:flagellar biosynthesis protein FlhA
MPPDAAPGVRGYILRNRGLIFPVLIVASVLVLLAPLPPLVLDLLLAANVTIAVVVLLTAIYVERPLDFSVFPALLLGTTLSRLVLNVASTRLILTRGGTEGTDAAGGVIEAFGHFVSGDSVVVGLIIFAILVTIQFVVITKGATRISEVAARFALDGMPGRQMAIDADLNAGLITQEEGKARRQEVADQADFYGAMDGAGKFVRGDAIAGIVITLINIIGGLYLGMVEHGMALAEAVRVFTTLTIGDGLVTQVPAFLISLAAGLIVTRSSSRSNLPREAVGQLFRHPEALVLAGLFLATLAATGLPALPLLSMSLICGLIGWNLLRARQTADATPAQAAGVPHRPEPEPEELLAVDPLELEVGVGLICLADPACGGDLLQRVTLARQAIARELGLILPKVRIRDNVRLQRQQYQIRIRGVAVAEGEIDPAVCLEASAVVIGQLTEVVRDHAADLLTRQQVHQLLDNLRRTSPKAVDELVPDVLKTAQVHQVLENLLRERVPIRDLETILETLGNHADKTTDLGFLTEHVRTALSRAICQQYRDSRRILHAIGLDPLLEEELEAAFSAERPKAGTLLSGDVAEAVARAVDDEAKRAATAGYPPVVLCSPPVRAGLRRLTCGRLPKLAVLSTKEVTRDTSVELLGQIGVEMLQVAAR